MVRAIKVVPLAEDALGGGPGAAAPRSFGAGSARRGSSGSGAMGKVPSLLFDLDDLGEGSQHPPARDSADEASTDDIVAKLHALLEPWSEPGKPSRQPLAPAVSGPEVHAMPAFRQQFDTEQALHCGGLLLDSCALCHASPACGWFPGAHSRSLDALPRPAEYMLLLHVRFAREDAAKRGTSLTVPELADTLRRLGYAVKIRAALGGGSGGACLRSLRHSFLTVSVAGPSGSLSYVLDPRFREQVRAANVRGCARSRCRCWACWLRGLCRPLLPAISARSPIILAPVRHPSGCPSLCTLKCPAVLMTRAPQSRRAV